MGWGEYYIILAIRLYILVGAAYCLRYEEQVREKRNSIQKEDLSDMVAEHAAKQKVMPSLA